MFDSGLNGQIDKELIKKERFTLYMNGMLPEFIGSIVAGLPFFYFVFSSQSSLYSTIIWFSLDAILLTSVLIIYYIYRQRFNTFDFPTWLKISYIPLILFSLNLAVAPWLFLQLDTDIYMYTMFVMIVSITGTVTPTIAYYFERLVLFSTTPLISLAIKFHTMESDNAFELYCVLILIWGASMSFAYRINKRLNRSITLTFEHIQARADAERINSEKSHFIAAASHDIRQPLQTANLLVNMLGSRNRNQEDKVIYERLENSIDNMSELLNRMLDVSKLDAHTIVPKPQHINLTNLFEQLKGELEPSCVDKGLNLIIKAEDTTAFADVILLKQVLNNLLLNAIRYSNHGDITLSAHSDGGHINISVKDTGIGIASENQELIFLEFRQLGNPERDQNKGLGLGLSIVKRLCHLQNWPLSLDSELNIGSDFYFRVPEGNQELIQAESNTNMTKNLTAVDVIIIDDNEDICFSLTQILNDWGCKVRSFESPIVACETLKQSPEWKPNLIISDYRLRNNVTGLEAIDSVKAMLGNSIEAIVLSGDTSPEIMIEIKNSGYILLSKPIKPAKLRLAISRKMKDFL